jgi:hypothetical protein
MILHHCALKEQDCVVVVNLSGLSNDLDLQQEDVNHDGSAHSLPQYMQ